MKHILFGVVADHIDVLLKSRFTAHLIRRRSEALPNNLAKFAVDRVTLRLGWVLVDKHHAVCRDTNLVPFTRSGCGFLRRKLCPIVHQGVKAVDVQRIKLDVFELALVRVANEMAMVCFLVSLDGLEPRSKDFVTGGGPNVTMRWLRCCWYWWCCGCISRGCGGGASLFLWPGSIRFGNGLFLCGGGASFFLCGSLSPGALLIGGHTSGGV